jgi:hypothetical protein
MPHRIRGLARVLAVLAVVSGLSLTSPARASNARAATTPACRASQMTASLVLPAIPYSPNRGFGATVWYTNVGATCYVTPDNLGYEAVSGPRHVVVGSSISGAVAYQSFVLQHGRQAYAAISIASISTPAFKQMVRTHGGSCTPKPADGVVLLGLGVNWPRKYFALPEKVPVCTTDYYNVVGNVIAKKLTPGEAGRAAMTSAAAALQDYLTLWHSADQATADQQFLAPGSAGAATLRLRMGTVVDWRQVVWTSLNRFTLLVTLDLHFVGSSGSWNVGRNDRYVTFSRSSSYGQWRMSFATGL